MISFALWCIGLWAFGSLCFALGSWWGAGPREDDLELARELEAVQGRLGSAVSPEDASTLRSAAYRLLGGRG